MVLLLVYVFNLSFLVLLAATIAKAALIKLLIAGLLLKICCELLFLFPVARFFGNQNCFMGFHYYSLFTLFTPLLLAGLENLEPTNGRGDQLNNSWFS